MIEFITLGGHKEVDWVQVFWEGGHSTTGMPVNLGIIRRGWLLDPNYLRVKNMRTSCGTVFFIAVFVDKYTEVIYNF